MALNSRCHSVYSLTAHLVIVTKYRYKLLGKPILARLFSIIKELSATWQVTILEINGEADHIHILFEYYPSLALTKFVNNLKTVSSRLLRKEFISLRKRPILWSRTYCLLSTGGATIEVIKKYIQEQGKKPPDSPSH